MGVASVYVQSCGDARVMTIAASSSTRLLKHTQPAHTERRAPPLTSEHTRFITRKRMHTPPAACRPSRNPYQREDCERHQARQGSCWRAGVEGGAIIGGYVTAHWVVVVARSTILVVTDEFQVVPLMNSREREKWRRDASAAHWLAPHFVLASLRRVQAPAHTAAECVGGHARAHVHTHGFMPSESVPDPFSRARALTHLKALLLCVVDGVPRVWAKLQLHVTTVVRSEGEPHGHEPALHVFPFNRQRTHHCAIRVLRDIVVAVLHACPARAGCRR